MLDRIDFVIGERKAGKSAANAKRSGTLLLSCLFDGDTYDTLSMSAGDTATTVTNLTKIFAINHLSCSDEIAITLQEVRSSEMDDMPGSGGGSTTGDIREAELGADDRRVLLRAERSGSGDGRRYEMTYRVADAVGNARIITLEVLVPHAVGEARGRR